MRLKTLIRKELEFFYFLKFCFLIKIEASKRKMAPKINSGNFKKSASNKNKVSNVKCRFATKCKLSLFPLTKNKKI